MTGETAQLAPSEDPWGTGDILAPERRHGGGPSGADSVPRERNRCAHAKVGCKPRRRRRMSGSDLTRSQPREGPTDRPALEPHWGKPTVRNLRGGGGNVGIIRSPVRAATLPDHERL